MHKVDSLRSLAIAQISLLISVCRLNFFALTKFQNPFLPFFIVLLKARAPVLLINSQFGLK